MDLDYLAKFCAEVNIPEKIIATKAPLLSSEIKTARRDQYKALLAFVAKLESYDLSTDKAEEEAPVAAGTPASATGILIVNAIKEYMEENIRTKSWATRTTERKRSELALIIELLGTDLLISDVTKSQAKDVKHAIQQLPKHRNKLRETTPLTIHDAIAHPGLEKVAPTAVNKTLTSSARSSLGQSETAALKRTSLTTCALGVVARRLLPRARRSMINRWQPSTTNGPRTIWGWCAVRTTDGQC